MLIFDTFLTIFVIFVLFILLLTPTQKRIHKELYMCFPIGMKCCLNQVIRRIFKFKM